MQFKYQLAILSLTALSIAQDLSSLPSCVKKGAASAIAASNCDASDTACLCNSASFTSSLYAYAKANCSTDDYNQATTAGQAICAAYSASSATTSDGAATSSTPAVEAVSEDDTDTDASTSGTDMTMTTTPVTTSTTTTMATGSTSMSNSTNGTLSLSTITRCSCQTEVVTLSASSTTTSTPSAVATYTGAASARGLSGDGFELLAGLIGIVGLMI